MLEVVDGHVLGPLHSRQATFPLDAPSIRAHGSWIASPSGLIVSSRIYDREVYRGFCLTNPSVLDALHLEATTEDAYV
jgi:hypothetical protein